MHENLEHEQMCLFPNIQLKDIHRSGQGFISIAQNGERWKERYYDQSEMLIAVNDWTGNDVYTSQNSFTKKHRSIMNVERLENLYVDIDCYTVDFTVDHALKAIKYLVSEDDIPNPNVIVLSGRGLQAIWNISPETADKIPMWQQVENWLCETLQHMGADHQATDVSRLVRLCGSYNSKNGNLVTMLRNHSHQYSLEWLHEKYLPKTKPKEDKTPERKKAEVKRLFTLHSLFWHRLQDIWHLVTIRQGQMDHMRETTLFLYRYHSCCFTRNPKQALLDTLELNKRFSKPLSIHEATVATKSAERKFLGSTRWKYKTVRIVEMLHITDEEQREMKNLIGKGEKRRREYLKRVKHVNKGKYEKVINAYLSGTTGLREISRLTGVSINTVRKYLARHIP